MGINIDQVQSGSGLGKVKAIFLDIDGTIVNSRHEITDRTRSTLAKAKEAGIKIGIASGRPFFAVRDIIADLNITDACMLFSGALVVDPRNGKSLHAAPLDPTVAKNALTVARELGIHAEVYTATEYFVRENNALVAMHQTYLKQAPIVTDQFAVIEREKIIKLVLVIDGKAQEEAFNAAKSRFGEVMFGIGFGAAHPNIVFANIISKGADRLIALAKLCELYGVTIEQCASFGDAEADLPFLTTVKYGVAMGNAPQNVREAAVYVTKPVNEDGVSYALDRLLVS